MKRIFLLTLATAVAGFATVTNAATLTVSADAPSYASGATITLTVTGSTNPVSEAASNFLVTLGVPGNVSFVSASAEQAYTPGMFGNLNWTVGSGESAVNAGVYTVFDQTFGTGSAPFGNNFNGVDESTVTATALFTAGAPGAAAFDFAGDTNFFGISGVSSGVTVTIIPEPTTAALMGLGLFGLAMAGRRR